MDGWMDGWVNVWWSIHGVPQEFEPHVINQHRYIFN
jgi:hypothetical protein